MEKVLSAILLINNKFQDKRVEIGSDQKLLLRTEYLGVFYKWQLAHKVISFFFILGKYKIPSKIFNSQKKILKKLILFGETSPFDAQQFSLDPGCSGGFSGKQRDVKNQCLMAKLRDSSMVWVTPATPSDTFPPPPNRSFAGITLLQKVLTFQLSFLVPNSDISLRG